MNDIFSQHNGHFRSANWGKLTIEPIYIKHGSWNDPTDTYVFGNESGMRRGLDDNGVDNG